MALNNFLKEELSDKKSVENKFDFWADESGNLLIDINDKEELLAYIKRRSGYLNKTFKGQLNGSDITKISIPEIINRIGWSRITLHGKKETVVLRLVDKTKPNSIEEKKYDSIIYTRARIRTDLPVESNKKVKNKNIDRVVENLKKIFPKIDRIKIIGANDNSTEFFTG